ncbi:MAG: hypothetical protein NT167_20355, partial [Verrucomicrobia bacterium]|nr:hypothetical protein [Verrucomicrobiota bacterium]
MKLIKANSGFLILALMASFVSGTIAVPVGTAFTYQGRLKSAGQSATGNYDLKFTLYDAASGSGQIGSPVTIAPVVLTNGNFTVSLDFGAVFSGEARWLEIGVRTNGSSSPYGTPSTRQALTPTPYALYAPSAGLAVTATTAGRVGGQAAAAVASGSVTANAATSANTPNTIVKRDASGNFSAGAITAAGFTGVGSGLTGLNAGQLTTGTVPTERLSGAYTGALTFNNGANFLSGNGAGLTSLNAGSLASGTVPSARLSGTYSSAVVFNNAGNSYTGNGSGLTGTGLAQTTVLNVNCFGGGVSYTATSFTKVADIGIFTKQLANSTIEVVFNGRTYATYTFGLPGAIFELRVDNTATSNGRARASYRESGVAVQTSITGIFTGLLPGNHAVSMWIQGVGGGGA